MSSVLNCGLESDSKFLFLKIRQLFFPSNNDQSVPQTSAWAATFCHLPFGVDDLGIVQGKNPNPKPQHKTHHPPKNKTPGIHNLS